MTLFSLQWQVRGGCLRPSIWFIEEFTTLVYHTHGAHKQVILMYIYTSIISVEYVIAHC